jgi:hypothetical protein
MIVTKITAPEQRTDAGVCRQFDRARRPASSGGVDG